MRDDTTRPARGRPAPARGRERAARAAGAEGVLALQRSAGNAAVSRLLARAPLEVEGRGIEFSFGAFWAERGAATGADVWAQPGAQRVELPVRAGVEGRLRMQVIAHVTSPRKGFAPEMHYTLQSWCEWTVHIAPDGTLEAGPAAPGFTGPAAAPVQQAGVPQAAAAAREFTLTPAFVGESSSGGVDLVVYNQGDALPAAGGGTTFVAALAVAKPEPRPEPAPVSGRRAFERKTHDVKFVDEGNVALPPGEDEQLLQWFGGLSPRTRQRLRAGTQKIRASGYASNTGPAARNRTGFAQPRLAAVERALHGYVAEGAWIAVPYGENALPGQDLGQAGPPEERRDHEHPDPARLIVRLEVEDDRTPDAHDLDFEELMPQ